MHMVSTVSTWAHLHSTFHLNVVALVQHICQAGPAEKCSGPQTNHCAIPSHAVWSAPQELVPASSRAACQNKLNILLAKQAVIHAKFYSKWPTRGPSCGPGTGGNKGCKHAFRHTKSHPVGSRSSPVMMGSLHDKLCCTCIGLEWSIDFQGSQEVAVVL